MACVKLSPDLRESIAVTLPRSPEMLRPCEPVLLALRGREGLLNPLLDSPEVLTLGLLPYTHLHWDSSLHKQRTHSEMSVNFVI